MIKNWVNIMKKRVWFRIGTICLAVVMLLSVVAALSYDYSGDGKTDVWDLQMAVSQNKSADEQAAAAVCQKAMEAIKITIE